MGWKTLFLGLTWLLAAAASAAADLEQRGRWASDGALSRWGELPAGPAPALTGGRFVHELHVTLAHPERLVIDFANSSVVAQFEHRVYSAEGEWITTLNGGSQQSTPGDYFLRHGLNLALPAGQYRIESRLDSPFYLAQPTPRLYREAHYQRLARSSQALTLSGLGIFLALGFYYLVMGVWRRAATDLLYAGFIVGNLLFNSSAQLVFRDLFGWQWIYWVSLPIMVSNIIYIGFVMALLGITARRSPRLFKVGLAAIALLLGFWPLAVALPNWTLEFARYGVAVFALYGLSAAISESLARNRVAYFYLIANAAFVLPALIAISLKEVALVDFLLIEQIGMVAVLIEVLLLAQVMSYQIALVYKERAQHQVTAEQHHLLARLAAQVPGLIYQFKMAPDGHFTAPFASSGLHEMFELSPEAVRIDASPALQRVIPEDYPAFMASIAQSAANLSPWVHEFRVLLPRQGLRWRAGNSQPERQDDGSILWHGFITDVTERKQIDEKIRHMAQHDPLTGLPNRALFMDRLERALAQAKRQHEQLALMFVDLDNFKPINDQHGHQVGDALLRQIARQLSLSLRASDTAARIGGDEFVVLLQPVHGAEDALMVAQKIQAALRSPHIINGLPLQISASIGIALYPEHGHSAAVLLRAADAAMYQIKQTGRDNIHVYSKPYR